jgi:hypothetical protein
MGKSLNYEINVLVGKKINNGVGNQNGTTMFPSKDILTYGIFTISLLQSNYYSTIQKLYIFKYKVI